MTHASLLSRYAKRLVLSDSVPELRRRAQGSYAQIVDLLDEILVAHTHAICFENLDVTAFAPGVTSRPSRSTSTEPRTNCSPTAGADTATNMPHSSAGSSPNWG